MRFYTNVHQRFDEILVRGYENGKHFTARETFHPTFFVPSKRNSKYKTLEGDSVEPIKPGKISRQRCRQVRQWPSPEGRWRHEPAPQPEWCRCHERPPS